MYTKNCKIIGVDRLDSSISMHNVYVNKSHDFHIGNVCDESFMKKVFELYRPNKVVHLASMTKMSHEIEGVESVLDCCDRYDVKGFTYISTNQIYNPRTVNKVTEESSYDLYNYHGVVKAAVENLISISKVPYSIIRTGEVFGPRQINFGHIPQLIFDIQFKDKAFSDDLVSGKYYLYIEDLCNVIEMVCGNQIKETFNLSSDDSITDLELISLVANKLSKNPQQIINNIIVASKEDKAVCMDNSKIKSIGWKQSNLMERLKFTINWYKNNSWIWQ